MPTISLRLEGNEKKHCVISIDYTHISQSPHYIIYGVNLISKSKSILQINPNQYSIFKEPHYTTTNKLHFKLFAEKFLPNQLTQFLSSTNNSQHIFFTIKEKEEFEQKIINLIERSQHDEIH